MLVNSNLLSAAPQHGAAAGHEAPCPPRRIGRTCGLGDKAVDECAAGRDGLLVDGGHSVGPGGVEQVLAVPVHRGAGLDVLVGDLGSGETACQAAEV